MSSWHRTRWTLLVLIVAAAASAPLWHRLWDLQDHELRIWLGVYCFGMAGALTSAFDVFVRTRLGGPSYEPLWLTAWPLWSVAWFAVVASWIAVAFGLIVLIIALPVIGLLYLPYRWQARGIRADTHGPDADEMEQFEAWLHR